MSERTGGLKQINNFEIEAIFLKVPPCVCLTGPGVGDEGRGKGGQGWVSWGASGPLVGWVMWPGSVATAVPACRGVMHCPLSSFRASKWTKWWRIEATHKRCILLIPLTTAPPFFPSYAHLFNYDIPEYVRENCWSLVNLGEVKTIGVFLGENNDWYILLLSVATQRKHSQHNTCRSKTRALSASVS